MDKTNLIDIDELEVVKLNGKTWVRLPEVEKKEPIADITLPSEFDELLRSYKK